MRANDVTVLDIGSEKITVFYGSKSVNNTFNVKASASVPYEGFADGEWLNEENLPSVIEKAIKEVEESARIRIRKLFIGVPGEFTTAVAKEVSIAFDRKRRVTDRDIDDLYERGNTYKDHKRYATINYSAIYYTLDDNRRLIDPIGLATVKLNGLISYVLCERKFLRVVNGVMKSLGMKEVEFISSVWAESMYLFEEEQRDRTVILADVGYITSSVVVARGDGLLYMSSFSCGGAHITGDITLNFNIPYSHAEQLTTKINLKRKVDDNDVYVVNVKENSFEYPAVEVNEIAKTRLTFLGQAINKCLARCSYDCPLHLPVFITGGGITQIQGAKELLSRITGRSVDFIEPKDPNYAKPYYSSTLGLMEIASKHADSTSLSIWDRLFNRK